MQINDVFPSKAIWMFVILIFFKQEPHESLERQKFKKKEICALKHMLCKVKSIKEIHLNRCASNKHVIAVNAFDNFYLDTFADYQL